MGLDAAAMIVEHEEQEAMVTAASTDNRSMNMVNYITKYVEVAIAQKIVTISHRFKHLNLKQFRVGKCLKDYHPNFVFDYMYYMSSSIGCLSWFYIHGIFSYLFGVHDDLCLV